MLLTPAETRAALIQALRDFDTAHKINEESQLRYRQLDQSLDTVKAQYAADIASELDANGKPVHSNAEKRAAELARRLADQAAELLRLHYQADELRRADQAALERCHESLKAHRMVADLMAQELRYQAARAQAELTIGDIEIPF